MEKSFLIDVVSKVYIATDSSPVDMQTYELCSDMIDVVIDVSCIYGYVFFSHAHTLYKHASISFPIACTHTVTMLHNAHKHIRKLADLRAVLCSSMCRGPGHEHTYAPL